MLAKHALSQLSYSPELFAQRALRSFEGEQLTLLRVHALSQLSYSPIFPWEWWAREDSNLRPHAYQACALTT